MSGLDDSILCGDILYNKTCTSYAQKVEHCKKDGRGDNKSNNTTDINALSDGMGGLDISDDKLFADPPPKEDCPICMLPMPFTTGMFGHWMIAAKSGYDDALKEVGKGYKHGLVTKDEFAIALRAHKDSQDEMKSTQRAIAAARFPQTSVSQTQ